MAHAAKAMVLHSYYSNLMGHVDLCTAISHLDELFAGTRQTPSQAARLVEPFSLQELKAIFLSMRKDSALGPDGFMSIFYQQVLPMVQADLLQLLHDFHRGSADLERLPRPTSQEERPHPRQGLPAHLASELLHQDLHQRDDPTAATGGSSTRPRGLGGIPQGALHC
jgi:hypothetical protein